MSEAILAVFAASWAGMWMTEVWQREPVRCVRLSTSIALMTTAAAIAIIVAKFLQSEPTAGEWATAAVIWGMNLLYAGALACLRHRQRREIEEQPRRSGGMLQ